MPQNHTDSVRLDFLRPDTLNDMASTEKLRYIIDRIRNGHVVVLEDGLAPEEQSRLVEMTMGEINQDEFKGIEIETYPSEQKTHDTGGLVGFVERTIRSGSSSDMTVIGPAGQMETLHRDKDQISTRVNP